MQRIARLFATTAIAAVGFGHVAVAADMALKAPPVAVPYLTWSGFYAGLNAGGSRNRNDVSIETVPVTSLIGDPDVITAHAFPAAASATGSVGLGKQPSFIGGAQFGYNEQFGAFLAGFETDIQGIANRSSSGNGVGIALVAPPSAAAVQPDVTTFTASNKLDYLGTVRGRLGVLAGPAFLAYMTAGIAYGKVTSSAGFTTTNTAYIILTGLGPVWGTAGSFSSTRTGWTIGGGGEWKFATNFSLKVEYLYYDLGSTNYSIGTSGAPVRSGAQAGLPWFTNASTASTRFDGNIVRVGLNYEFGYAPASAAYK